MIPRRWQKGLASRIDQMWYLEPKWLRYSIVALSTLNGFSFTQVAPKLFRTLRPLEIRDFTDSTKRTQTGTIEHSPELNLFKFRELLVVLKTPDFHRAQSRRYPKTAVWHTETSRVGNPDTSRD